MQRMFNRVYYLMTLTRPELFKEATGSFITIGTYLVFATLLYLAGLTSTPRAVLAGVVGLLIYGGLLLTMDMCRLKGQHSIRQDWGKPKPEENEKIKEKTYKELDVVTTQEEAQFFSFSERVVDLFGRQDGMLMSELLVNQNLHKLEEVSKYATELV